MTKNEIPYDPTTYFFAKIGSSFSQLPTTTNCYSIIHLQARICIGFLFSLTNVALSKFQSVLALAKKILTKDILAFIDEQASEVYLAGHAKVFPYKSLSQALTLAVVTLLRELLRPQNGNFNVAPYSRLFIKIVLL